jgi:hypothetical protein
MNRNMCFIIHPSTKLFSVRRNETICCLIGFGIGVGCCVLYRIISNFLTSSNNKKQYIISKRDVSTRKYIRIQLNYCFI